MRKIIPKKRKNKYVSCNKSDGVDNSVSKQRKQGKQKHQALQKEKAEISKEEVGEKKKNKFENRFLCKQKCYIYLQQKRHKGEERKICSKFLKTKECIKTKCALSLY